MKTIVISGINIFEGGPLSVFKDCLTAIVENGFNKEYRVICFVHKKGLFNEYVDLIEIIELPRSRNNYFIRLWYEYVYFYFYSRKTEVDIWLSIHDVTPNVIANKRFVYCHNASPFYKMNWNEIKLSPKLKFFNLFYKYLYKINIKKNESIIVQQDWIKKEFIKMYGIYNIIVAHPDTSYLAKGVYECTEKKDKVFFYPSLPRVFKNFEVICEAVEILHQRSIADFKIILTLDGTENNYAKSIYTKYSNNKSIHFVGLLEREKVYNYYEKSCCMIFPSKLETWGLPITEYKVFGKPMILADLEYAKETLGYYEKVYFFDINNSVELADIIEKHLQNTIVWKTNREVIIPDTSSWIELFEIIFSGNV